MVGPTWLRIPVGLAAAVATLVLAGCAGASLSSPSAKNPAPTVLAATGATSSPAAPPTVSPAPTSRQPAPKSRQPAPSAPSASDSFYVGPLAFWNDRDGLAGLTIDHPDGSTSGELLSTHDGGASWTEAPAPTGIVALAVTGSADAWAIAGCSWSGPSCQALLYRTIDGGVTWTAAPTDLSAISFAAPLDGWGVVGSGPTADPGTVALRRTTDGGQTWTTMRSPCVGSAVGPLRSISLRTTTSGLAVCALTAGAGGELHAVLATSDGGRHWSIQSSTSDPSGGGTIGSLPYGGYIVGIVEAQDGTAWIAGERMTPLVSGDLGATWRPLALGDSAADLVKGAYPLDARRGFATMWAPDRQATLFEVTTDGGRSWAPRYAWSVATGRSIAP